MIMKKLITAIVTALAVVCFTFSADAQDKKDSKFTEVTYDVFLHCEKCQKKVESSIPYVKGVKDLKVDLKAQTVWVKFDNKKTTKESIVKELKELGFTAKEVKKEPAKKK